MREISFYRCIATEDGCLRILTHIKNPRDLQVFNAFLGVTNKATMEFSTVKSNREKVAKDLGVSDATVVRSLKRLVEIS